MPSNGAERHRLFFALWPPEPVRAALWELVRRSGSVLRHGRPMARDNLHLTLSFIGPVTAPVAECLAQRAATVRVPPFDLELDRYGCFPGPGILWLGPQHVPAPLGELAQALRAAQQDCGIPPEARPFSPHVTLRRKVKGGAEVPPHQPGVRWPVREFALVESHTLAEGVQYRVRRSWPLGGC